MRNTTKLFVVSAFTVALSASSLALAAQSAGQYIDDATITTKVKAALLSDSELKATQVSVVTDEGTVKLTGAVDSKSQEAEVVRVANQITGVHSVNDLLTVRSTTQDQ